MKELDLPKQLVSIIAGVGGCGAHAGGGTAQGHFGVQGHRRQGTLLRQAQSFEHTKIHQISHFQM